MSPNARREVRFFVFDLLSKQIHDPGVAGSYPNQIGMDDELDPDFEDADEPSDTLEGIALDDASVVDGD
jgi:hypothetical protein